MLQWCSGHGVVRAAPYPGAGVQMFWNLESMSSSGSENVRPANPYTLIEHSKWRRLIIYKVTPEQAPAPEPHRLLNHQGFVKESVGSTHSQYNHASMLMTLWYIYDIFLLLSTSKYLHFWPWWPGDLPLTHFKITILISFPHQLLFMNTSAVPRFNKIRSYQVNYWVLLNTVLL